MVRLKHRYLLVNILYPEQTKDKKFALDTNGNDIPYALQFRRPSDDRVDAKLLSRLIRDGVADLFGDYGSGMIASSLQVKYFSPATSTAIIRVARDHYRLVWCALAFTIRLPKPVDASCVFQVVRVSGTIKKAEEEAIRRARRSIRRANKAGDRSTRLPNSTTVSTLANVPVEEWNDDAGMDFANGIEDPDEPEDMDEGSD